MAKANALLQIEDKQLYGLYQSSKPSAMLLILNQRETRMEVDRLDRKHGRKLERLLPQRLSDSCFANKEMVDLSIAMLVSHYQRVSCSSWCASGLAPDFQETACITEEQRVTGKAEHLRATRSPFENPKGCRNCFVARGYAQEIVDIWEEAGGFPVFVSKLTGFSLASFQDVPSSSGQIIVHQMSHSREPLLMCFRPIKRLNIAPLTWDLENRKTSHGGRIR